MIRGIAWNYGRRGENGYESENREAVEGKQKEKCENVQVSPAPLFEDYYRYYEIILWLFRFAPTLPAKRNDAGKVSESYEFFKIPTQIKKRSNARFLSTLLRYLSSILTIYFCLGDNLGCPMRQDCAPSKHWAVFNYLIKYYHFTSFLSTLLHEKSPGESGRAAVEKV